jgi:hypothetical protein
MRPSPERAPETTRETACRSDDLRRPRNSQGWPSSWAKLRSTTIIEISSHTAGPTCASLATPVNFRFREPGLGRGSPRRVGEGDGRVHGRAALRPRQRVHPPAQHRQQLAALVPDEKFTAGLAQTWGRLQRSTRDSQAKFMGQPFGFRAPGVVAERDVHGAARVVVVKRAPRPRRRGVPGVQSH